MCFCSLNSFMGTAITIFCIAVCFGFLNVSTSEFLSLIIAAINIITLAIYVSKVGDDGDWTYVQGFWMTVCSAALSFFCALLLLFHPRKYQTRGPGYFTCRQRWLIVFVMVFIS